ncbi:unnamed protein product [Owenia fusiformis]|uniref:sphingomyelin phosphodiesterase n=1 Tax=Owenia fusiformis TaxID=6347 RepID=A0A8S4PX97_OWEFU|nr:unnamed protein product [Owenia fusiformis]
MFEMAITLKVLTLNCWGVFTPLACDYRNKRIMAIGDELAKGEYDIVMLQEIWTQADYVILSNKVASVFPHHHYFHSGMFGSGLCVFSKSPIIEIFTMRYSINGYAHKIHHGDWFGNKAVGLAKIEYKGLKINLYITHALAEYNIENDEYIAQRMVQAYELSQFVKHTGETSDINIVGGDFNMRAEELGYRVITTNGNLEDAWLKQKEAPVTNTGMTSETPRNSFTNPKKLKIQPHGERIDFLMFRSNGGFTMECEKCYLPLDKVPDQTYSYSDHEAVAAIFTIRKNITAMTKQLDIPSRNKNFEEAVPVLQKGIKKAQFDRNVYIAALILGLVAFFFLDCIPMPYGLGWVLSCVEYTLVLGVVFSIWMSVVMCPVEENACIAAQKDMLIILNSDKIK